MTERIMQAGTAVPTFIESVIELTEKSLGNKGYIVCPEKEANIKLDLSATEVNDISGGVRLQIVSFGADNSSTNIQKITVFAKKKE